MALGAWSEGEAFVMTNRVPTDEDAPRAARALTAALIAELDGNADLCGDDLTLAVSEMVANAVVHGPPGEVTVRLLAEPTLIRAEVADPGVDSFSWPAAFPEDGHWGLHVVAAVSDRCGVERRPSTLTWCEFDLV